MKKKTKIKVLRPTLKEKKRYLVYDANYFGKRVADYIKFKQKVSESFLRLFGDVGYGEAGVMFVKGNGRKGVIRSNRQYVDHVKTALMMLKKVESSDVAVRCVGVSGTLDKAEKIMLNRRGG